MNNVQSNKVIDSSAVLRAKANPELLQLGHKALTLLEATGTEAYIVGGFVRDALLGRPQHDIDIATQAMPSTVIDLFDAAGWHVVPTGIDFGTITVVCNGTPIEVTTFRREGDYADHRHPGNVRFAQTIEEDLARRDFTINALAYRPRTGVVDLYGGLADLYAGIIRAVGDPMTRFGEDALRILRACRFASELDFSLECETEKALNACIPLLSDVAPERMLVELNKLLCGKAAYRVLTTYSAAVRTLIPELDACWGFDQHTPYHIYDVYEHTARCVQAAPATPLNRWLALLHDCGKPRAFTQDAQGIGHFKGHACISARLTHVVAQRLRMPRKFAEDLELLVLHHEDPIPETRAAAKRMLRILDGRTDLLECYCAMRRADTRSQSALARPRFAQIDAFERMAQSILAAHEAFRVCDLALNGNDLRACGLQPGPQIGTCLEAALEGVLEGACENERTCLIAYLCEQGLL